MAIRKRRNVSDQAENLAKQLADRPYGNPPLDQGDEMIVTSISINKSLLHRAEDLVNRNKRANIEPKSVSALIRKALERVIS